MGFIGITKGSSGIKWLFKLSAWEFFKTAFGLCCWCNLPSVQHVMHRRLVVAATDRFSDWLIITYLILKTCQHIHISYYHHYALWSFSLWYIKIRIIILHNNIWLLSSMNIFARHSHTRWEHMSKGHLCENLSSRVLALTSGRTQA